MYIIFFGWKFPILGALENNQRKLIPIRSEKIDFNYGQITNTADISELIKTAKFRYDCALKKNKSGPFGYLELDFDPLNHLFASEILKTPSVFRKLAKKITANLHFCENCGRIFTPRTHCQKFCGQKECQTARRTAVMKAYRNRRNNTEN